MGGGQDWQTVSFTKRPQSAAKGAGQSQEKSINEARRKGETIDTEKKKGGGSNKNVTAAGLNAARLENEDEELSRAPQSDGAPLALHRGPVRAAWG